MPPFGPPNIENLKVKGDVLGLVKALDYEHDYHVRKAAAVALGQLADPRAVPGLIKALGDTGHNFIHQDVVEALGQIADPRAVEPLSARIGHDFPPIEDAVVEALGRIGPPAVDHLVAVFEEALGRKRNVWTTGQSGRPDGFVGDVARALAQTGDRRAVGPLAAALEAHRASAYINRAPYGADYGPAVATALAQLGDQTYVDVVVDAAQRYWCSCPDLLQALGRMAPSDARVVAMQFTAARQWDKCVEMGAASVEPLVAFVADGRTCLDHTGNIIRTRFPHRDGEDEGASNALLAIGRQAVEPLIRVVESRVADDDNNRKTKAAIETLGRLGDPRAVDPIYAALEYCGLTGVAALLDIGEASVDRLIDTLELPGADLRLAAVRALAKIGTPRAIEGVQKAAVGNQIESVRFAAADELTRVTPGPMVVTAQERDGDLIARCPVCRGPFAVEQANLGGETICPRPSCRARIRLRSSIADRST